MCTEDDACTHCEILQTHRADTHTVLRLVTDATELMSSCSCGSAANATLLQLQGTLSCLAVSQASMYTLLACKWPTMHVLRVIIEHSYVLHSHVLAEISACCLSFFVSMLRSWRYLAACTLCHLLLKHPPALSTEHKMIQSDDFSHAVCDGIAFVCLS
jgi:hypothetical protein